jgi:hypothetical protein
MNKYDKIAIVLWINAAVLYFVLFLANTEFTQGFLIGTGFGSSLAFALSYLGNASRRYSER